MGKTNEYLVTQDLKSEMKLASRAAFYAKDAIFLLCFLGTIFLLKGFVSIKFQVLYWFVSIILGIILTVPSPWNPKRKNFEMIMLYFQRDESVYYPTYLKKRMMEDETMDKKKVKAIREVYNLLKIARYDERFECFVRKQGLGYMDIVQIISKDIVNASEDEKEFDIAKLTKFNKKEYEDYKIIALNFPCNTLEQQEFIRTKMEQTSNRTFLKYLNESLYELKWVQEQKSKREYYYMVFSPTLDGLKKMEADMMAALQIGDKMIGKMPQDKKEVILYRCCNPASILTGGAGN